MSETPNAIETRPIAVNLFSVRRQLIEDFEGTHARLADLGFLGVEPMIFGPVPLEALPEDLRVPFPEPADYRALLDDLGLSVASLHAPLPEGDAAESIYDFAETIGTDQLVLASFLALPGAANAHADLDVLRSAIDRFGEAAAQADRRGLTLGFHNHHWEWETPLDGRFAWEIFWAEVDARVTAEVDTYWARTAGQDPVAILEALGPRARRVHLKDGPCVLGEPQVALGEGNVDVAACVTAARHAAWHIIELDECATDMFEALGKSVRHLESIGRSHGRSTRA